MKSLQKRGEGEFHSILSPVAPLYSLIRQHISTLVENSHTQTLHVNKRKEEAYSKDVCCFQSKINAAEEWFDERKIFGFRVVSYG